MSNAVAPSLVRVTLERKKKELLHAILELPQEELSEDETEVMFILSFTPEQRKAILSVD